MKKPIPKICLTFLFAAITVGLAANARAADVRAHLSAHETYVGLPIILRIQVDDASNADPPTIPKIDGLEVRSIGTPSRSTRITSINGRTTTNTSLTFAYELTPQRGGSFRVPPITVHIDGADQHTPSLAFVASKSDTGDLMFVEIAGKQKQIYVGQALDLTLKIWLRPYGDREHGITLSEGDMWKFFSDRTAWGLFEDRMQQLADNDQRPVGKEVLRKDRNGVEHSYYLYQIDATIYPKRPGKIDASNVKVVVQYPTAIGKARDPFADFFRDMPMPGGQPSPFDDDSLFSPFASRLAIQSVRPIVAKTHADAINVLPIPKTGRPVSYRGAVGKYQIATMAKPTNVKAGDPIELSIGISGTGPMELVEAPPLADLPALANDFKVPTEPLAGFVKGNQKLFTVSIRPRRAGIAQIPAIPFSFFDPSIQKFVTVHSDPISIQVAPADTLALDAVVGHEKNAATPVSNEKSAEHSADAPSLSIFTSDDLLTSEFAHTFSPRQLLLLLGLPPLFVLGIAVVRAHRGFARLFGRLRSSTRRFHDQIEKAEQPAQIAAALQAYFARLTRSNGESPTAASVLGTLRSSGRLQLAVRCERIFDACEQQSFAASPESQRLDELKQDALHIVDDFRSDRQWRRPKSCGTNRAPASRPSSFPNTNTIRSIAVAIIAAGAIAIGSCTVSAETYSAGLALTPAQQKTLLHEANASYTQGQRTAKKEAADARPSFVKAAEKYQLLVDLGIENSRLYVNLANAYLESGQAGKAIANYRHALKFDPTNHNARANLALAERGIQTTVATSHSKDNAAAQSIQWEDVVQWVNSYVSPRATQLIMFIAWCALWASIGTRLAGYRFPWKTSVTLSAFCFALTATLFVFNWRRSNVPIAVVVANSTLYETDGPHSAPITDAIVHEGQVVAPLKERGGWSQIRTKDGQTGWLSSNRLETI
ncbi:MAG TPA: BatD family protein [Lacipirellulaceae bacterium]|nr:BatD family protein [Lacipirellulaceae bacterium]